MNYGSIGTFNNQAYGDNISGGSSINNGYTTKNSSVNVKMVLTKKME